MGCCGTAKKINNHQHRPAQWEKMSLLGIEFGYSYDLNFQYFFSVRGSKENYGRRLITVFPQGQRTSKFYLLAVLEHSDKRIIQEHHARLVSKYFEEKLSAVNWRKSEDEIYLSISEIFGYDKREQSTKKTNFTIKAEERPSIDARQIDTTPAEKFLKLVKFSLVVTQEKIYIIQSPDTDGFTIKNRVIADKNLSNPFDETETEIVTKKKKDIDFLFFGEPDLFNIQQNALIWNKYNKKLDEYFPKQREQIGWKFTLGEIQQIYKGALISLFDDLAAAKDHQFANGYGQLGVIAIGGF